jgi:hypothetical protein
LPPVVVSGLPKKTPIFLPELVDKNHTGFGFVDNARQFAHRLGHQTSLQAHLRLAHIAVNLGLGYKGRDRVDDDDIERATAH